MAEYRGVNNVAREIVAEWRGVSNVARQVVKAWRGVSNVARQYFGYIRRIIFTVPSDREATVDSEFAGFDGDTIKLSFTNAKRASDAFLCRASIMDLGGLYDGTQFSFTYTLSSSEGASSNGFSREIQFRDVDENTLKTIALADASSETAVSYTIPENTDFIIIGFWSNSYTTKSAELIISNMYVGDEKII